MSVRCARRFLAALVSMLAMSAAGAHTAHAGDKTWIFGTNLGFVVSDGVVVFGSPHSVFEGVRPGIRLGMQLPGSRSEIFTDHSLVLVSGSGSTDHLFAGTVNYQFNFKPAPLSGGFVTGGLGVFSGDGTATIMGAGIGRRTWLENGHAAVRFEGRVDRMSQHGVGDTFYGVKLGIDVKLN